MVDPGACLQCIMSPNAVVLTGQFAYVILYDDICRCPQTYLLEATLEWKNGYEERARRAFVQGSRYAAGSPECYSPLFQAWAHFEEVCGHTTEAARLATKCAQIQNAEQKRRRRIRTVSVTDLVASLGYSGVRVASAGVVR